MCAVGATPALRSLDALMRRTAQGMTGKKALLLSPPPYLPPLFRAKGAEGEDSIIRRPLDLTSFGGVTLKCF